MTLLYNLPNLYQYFPEHPDEEFIFDQAMQSLSIGSNPNIIEAYDFSGFQSIVDVGGGIGIFLTMLRKQYSTLRCILFERPEVIANAVAREIDPDIELVAGDFYQGLPPADAYILKHVLHNLDEQDCIRLLQSCKKSMPEQSVLLVCEQIVTDSPTSSHVKGLDLLMSLEQEGGERTEEEMRLLFEKTGLRVRRAIPTQRFQWIFEATH